MKRAIAVVFALLLAGCAGSAGISSEVTRFHQLPQAGGTVAVVAQDERKAGGPEFRAFADRAAADLATAGYAPATADAPDYIAQLDYYQQPVVGGEDTGGGPRVSLGFSNTTYGRHSAVGMGVGTSFDIGGGRGQTAMRTVTLVIERRADGTRVFEGRAQSMGPAENFLGAVPYMIDAIFTGFPGESGKTVTVETAVDRR